MVLFRQGGIRHIMGIIKRYVLLFMFYVIILCFGACSKDRNDSLKTTDNNANSDDELYSEWLNGLIEEELTLSDGLLSCTLNLTKQNEGIRTTYDIEMEPDNCNVVFNLFNNTVVTNNIYKPSIFENGYYSITVIDNDLRKWVFTLPLSVNVTGEMIYFEVREEIQYIPYPGKKYYADLSFCGSLNYMDYQVLEEMIAPFVNNLL